ncbi:helix-turn-helix transcriptional regulator [Limibacillus sp. MBR-115]|jgi:transcriptional regulator with XRE-family HTH domain|uniref:helix-turn-helix domain-containing protein n=1 Tax=Limibacillus sp. MBR-115 TaxID=3156465 RepID=UPI00339B54F3
MSIGKTLFSLRQKSGQSLQQVADAVGVSKAHVWELEKGRSQNPSFELVQRLARHFGVAIDVLVGGGVEPDADALQVARLHRGLEELTAGDRKVVEQMIEALKDRARETS